MKPTNRYPARKLAMFLLALGLLAAPGARAEVTDVSNVPLVQGTSENVLPNMMFILDDSGSMSWSFMPDQVLIDVNPTSICYKTYLYNRIYYNPNLTYTPPVDANGNPFANADFFNAPYDGFDVNAKNPITNTAKVNLSTQFTAYDTKNCWNYRNCGGSNADDQGSAYYYRADSLTAAPTTSCTNTFRNSLNKITVSATSGPGGTDERQNFANWYSYYRTRILAMKTAAGQAFKADFMANFRVGFLTINPGSPVNINRYLKIDRFETTHKANWYTKLYAQVASGGTPLREALSRAGRHFAAVKSGINQGMSDDPLQYSCQQNFALLTTDGFWNDSAGQTLTGGSIGNRDNVEDTSDPKYTTRSAGTFDGNRTGATNTLADVAMYYYKTDLRPAGSTNDSGVDVSENNVPRSPKEPEGVTHQRMLTFSLGLGVNGRVTYQPDYEIATSGQFRNIRDGVKNTGGACPWEANGATCNWPVPAADSATALDDLWHAAVNGRGKYLSAQDPAQLVEGLTAALAGVSAKVGAAAASATSSPNITQTNNFIFSTTYRTVVWDGEVVAQRIDTTTGNVIPTVQWSARTNLESSVAPAGDSRTIYTFNATGTSRLKPFRWSDLAAAEQNFFKNKCLAPFQLSQCGDLNATDQATANNGENVVNFLRGQTQHEGGVYRNREFVLGDLVNSTPIFVEAPQFEFGEGIAGNPSTAYGEFKADNADRQAVLYVGGNDGMLHAFNADNGSELWAYLPRMVMPNLYKLADQNYSTKHQYFVDGSPAVMDVFFGGSWKTILVGGLNAGGRGFYALDITDPLNPTGLWEVCSDSTLCAISDVDMGFSFGNPLITKRPSDGKWVVIVTSGFNNVNPGNGKGQLYVLDAQNGTILDKITTNVGDIIPVCAPPALCGPSGLGKISGFANDFLHDNTSLSVYGGDLWGNLWEFDFTVSPVSVRKLAELKDSEGKPQSVTTRPELGEIAGKPVVFVGTGRYIGIKDLSEPDALTPPLPYAFNQSFYAVKDTDASYGNFRGAAGVVQQNITQVTDTTRRVSGNTVDWETGKGWYLDFNPGNASPGERVNIDPILVLGTLIVTTNVPNSNACTAGGDSWIYQLDYYTGGYVSTTANHEAGKKQVGTLTVGNVVIRLPSGSLKVISTRSTGEKTTGGVDIGGGAGKGRRISWRELIR